MPHLVKCLSYKHKDPSPTSRTYIKDRQMVHDYNLDVEETRVGGSLGLAGSTAWPS